MLEAAHSINPAHDPELFARLTGRPDSFVTDENNPYQEHDDEVSDQHLAYLTWLARQSDLCIEERIEQLELLGGAHDTI